VSAGNKHEQDLLHYLQDMVAVHFVVLGHVLLVLPGVRRSPRSSLMRIKTPTDSVVFAGVFLVGDGAVNLPHRCNDHTDVISLGHGLKRRAGGSGVTREHDTGTSCCSSRKRSGKSVNGQSVVTFSNEPTIDLVSRVTGRANTRQVSVSTSSEDRVVNVLPESSLVHELYERNISFGPL
jgi:hypothetical protein